MPAGLTPSVREVENVVKSNNLLIMLMVLHPAVH